MAFDKVLDIGAEGGTTFGKDANAKISFYGGDPVVQRSAAIQAVSTVSAASYISVASNLAAWVTEVTNTLTGLKLWKGS